MKRIRILTILAILPAISSGFSLPIVRSGAPKNRVMGRIHLSALTPKDERLRNLTIFIEGEGVRREVKPKGFEGEYENEGFIELREGTYRLTTGNSWYHPFRRAAFRVRAGTVTRINVFPVTRILSQALKFVDGRAHDEYAFSEPQSYESLYIATASHLDLLIRFDEKKKSGKWIEYAGKIPKVSGTVIEVEGEESEAEEPRGVMVSYDALAIYADKVRFNRNALELVAEGNVVIEDGVQRIHKQRVHVRFKKGAPEIDLN
jgi:hypothetical protein